MARAVNLEMSGVISRARRADGLKAITLSLGPLLAPHRKHGRLSLRIERLPQQARFSAGNRNNDGSWSLATDELDDLTYQLPETFEQAHTLAIRIISLTNGNTLAVVEFPVTPNVADEDTGATNDKAADAQVQALREQLAQMKAELALAREAAGRAVPPAAAAPTATVARAHDVEAEIEAVRAELKSEFDERLVAVGAQAAAEIQKHRNTWTTELNTRVAAATEAAQAQAADTVAKAESAWQKNETARLVAAQAQWREAAEQKLTELRAELSAAHGENQSSEIEALRASLQREANEAIAAAHDDWKAQEAERLAAAEAQWRSDADKALADARTDANNTQLDALREKMQREAQEALTKAQDAWQTDETSRLAAAEARWKTEEAARLIAAEARWRVESEKTLERGHNSDVDALRVKLQLETQEALAKAEEQWMAAEAARFAEAEAQWQQTSAKVLAEVRAQAAAAREDSVELEALRDDLAALQAKLAERDTALTQARKDSEAQRVAARRETQEAIVQAETVWKGQEAERLTAAQARWRADADKALAAAKAAAREIRIDGDDGGLNDLREKVAELEAMLAERDATLAEAQDIIEQQTQAAHLKARHTRKADDAARQAEAEAEWRSSYGNALAEATARYEAAEAALAQVRIRTKDGGRLQQDLASARAALAAREKELADLRAVVAPLDGQGPEGEGEATAEATEAVAVKPAPYSRAFIGSVIAAACLMASAIVFYPSIEALIAGTSHAPAPAAAPKVEERLAPVAVDERKATLLRDAKLRAEATPSAKVVATISRGSEVVILQTQDKWTLVRFNGAKSLQGWVPQNVLADAPAK